MCSIIDDDYENVAEIITNETINTVVNGQLCLKCNATEATITLRGKDIYCQSCFLISATHKFRATLGKSKIVRPKDKILVGHSGGAGSTALLHLIKSGMLESVHKRLIFQTQVIYIDEGMLKQQTHDLRQTTIKNILQQIKSFGFQGFVVSLSECLRKTEPINVQKIDNYVCTSTDNNDECLVAMFNKLSNDTAKEDLLKKLRHGVIVSAAKLLGCGKIFLADEATSLAISLLSNVSLGRGAQLSSDVGFIDNRYTDVMILRPMRDFSRHELNCYLNCHCLELVDNGNLIFSTNPHASIQCLTKQFVMDLDSQFSGTVSTIFRTGEKLSAGRLNSHDNSSACVLCNAYVDTVILDDATSAIAATTFSRFMSSQGANAKLDITDRQIINGSLLDKTMTNCCGDCQSDDCVKSNPSNMSLDDIRKCLCYGCRLIIQDKFNVDSLPFYVINAARHKLSLESMREQITDFLL